MIERREPIRLVKESDTSHVVAHACGSCGVVFASAAEAQRCSRCAPCKCGAPTTARYSTVCEVCEREHQRLWSLEWQRRELAKVDHIIPFAEYVGDQLFLEDEYFGTDDVDDDGSHWRHEDPIPWAHACSVQTTMPKFDAGDLLEQMCEREELGEDCAASILDDLDAEGLQNILDEWTSAQPYTVYWQDPACLVAIAMPVDELQAMVDEAKAGPK